MSLEYSWLLDKKPHNINCLYVIIHIYYIPHVNLSLIMLCIHNIWNIHDVA